MLLLAPLLTQAQSIPDRAVVGVLQRAAPGVKSNIVHRTAITPELDVVVAVAGSEIFPRLEGPGFAWTEDTLLGLFLQDRGNPNLVYRLALAPGHPDCFARVERATLTDTVLTCTAEKISMHPSRKFVYDVRAKTLAGELEYQPFAFARAFARQQGAVLVATDSSSLLVVAFEAVRQPPFRVMSDAAAQAWIAGSDVERGTVGVERRPYVFIPPAKFRILRFSAFSLIEEEDPSWGSKLTIIETRDRQTIRHELPKSTFDQFAAARPQRVADGYRRDSAKFDERIGPHQLYGGKMWFGKTFYDSEGSTGIGGFGYFDPLTKAFTLFTAPEIRDLSVSALLVEEDAVWLALIHRGEYGDLGGGVLRFDRATQTYRRFETPGRVSQILRVGERLLLPNHLGIDTIDVTGIHRYFVDKTTDGRLRIALAEK